MTPPELRKTVSGKDVSSCKFAAYTGKKGDKYNPSLWFKLVAWEQDARRLMTFDDKEKVVITGLIGYEAWKNVEGKGDYTITIRSISGGDTLPVTEAKRITEGYRDEFNKDDDFIPEPPEEDDVPL